MPTRRRGDLEVAGEDFDFMGVRLSHGDDVYFAFGFRMADCHECPCGAIKMEAEEI
jgi:hypothetical protein